jgi:hypothetical protein
MGYHQGLPLTRVVAHVGNARQAQPHLGHNPLLLLGACNVTPTRKLNDPALLGMCLIGPVLISMLSYTTCYVMARR